MNIKTKILELLQKSKTASFDHPRISVMVASCLAIAVLCSLIWFYSSDLTDVPAAAVLENDATVQHEESVADLSDADAIAEQSKQLEPKREAAKRELDQSLRDQHDAAVRRSQLEKEYEELLKKHVPVTDADLDARERKLLADLRELQGQ